MQIVKVQNLEELLRTMLKHAVEDVAYSHMRQISSSKFEIDDDAIAQSFNGVYLPPHSIDVNVLKTLDDEAIVEHILILHDGYFDLIS